MMMDTRSTMSTVRRPSLLAATALLMGIAAVSAVGCSSADVDPTTGETVAEVGLSWEEFQANVYQEPESGIYIVDGDTPIDDIEELKEFYLTYVQSGALIVHTVGGVDAKWDATKKLNLTYCVSSTFGTNKAKVVQAMADATAAWKAAANIEFKYVSAQDGSCTASNNNVLFDVRPVNSGGQYLARAFFPDSSRSGRNVLIDNTAFGNINPWTLAGILRHELGHSLGFRHEHTRPEAGGSCFEDNNWRQLTSYDAYSVMHYPQCNGKQTGDLVLTANDKAGAVALYGAPGGGGNPQPVTCAHPICSTGVKLDPTCDTCAATICGVDPYCCNNDWDSQCVGEVQSICGQPCQ